MARVKEDVPSSRDGIYKDREEGGAWCIGKLVPCLPGLEEWSADAETVTGEKQGLVHSEPGMLV